MTLFLVVSEIRGGVFKVYAKKTAAQRKAAPTTNVRGGRPNNELCVCRRCANELVKLSNSLLSKKQNRRQHPTQNPVRESR